MFDLFVTYRDGTSGYVITTRSSVEAMIVYKELQARDTNVTGYYLEVSE
jgi:hypothetical protein